MNTGVTKFNISKTNAKVRITNEFVDAIVLTENDGKIYARVLYSNEKLRSSTTGNYPSIIVKDFECDLPYYEMVNGKCYYNENRIVSEEIGLDGIKWITFACGDKVKCKR